MVPKKAVTKQVRRSPAKKTVTRASAPPKEVIRSFPSQKKGKILTAEGERRRRIRIHIAKWKKKSEQAKQKRRKKSA